MSESAVSRRSFVAALPLTVLATPSALAGETGIPWQQVRGPGFIDPFTPEEASAVAASSMAQEIATLVGQGYPCSEMILLAALRRFELPEDHLPAAAVFGGGVGKRDLCGLLTGGLMAIGFAAADRTPDRTAMHQAGRQASNAYWEWWLSRGDLHCMGPGTAHETGEEFVRMCQRAAVKLEDVIAAI
jgi:hypothetical protein